MTLKWGGRWTAVNVHAFCPPAPGLVIPYFNPAHGHDLRHAFSQTTPRFMSDAGRGWIPDPRRIVEGLRENDGDLVERAGVLDAAAGGAAVVGGNLAGRWRRIRRPPADDMGYGGFR